MRHKQLILNALTLFFLFSIQSNVNSQGFDELRGRGVFKKYDNTFISPDYRRKHSVSLGVQHCMTSPLDEFSFPNFGGHIGYNYFLIKAKTRILSAKKKQRDEIKIGFGAHFSIYQNKEWFFTAVVYRPLIAIKGTMLSFFMFNEFGIGVHRTVEDFEGLKGPYTPSLSLEVFRLRFGRRTALYGGVKYATRNEFFSKEPKEVSVMAGMRFYIYKKK